MQLVNTHDGKDVNKLKYKDNNAFPLQVARLGRMGLIETAVIWGNLLSIKIEDGLVDFNTAYTNYWRWSGLEK